MAKIVKFKNPPTLLQVERYLKKTVGGAKETINARVYEGTAEALDKVTQEATQLAQNELILADKLTVIEPYQYKDQHGNLRTSQRKGAASGFTQKHGGEYLSKFVRRFSGRTNSLHHSIIAGSYADDDIRKELFYAEYGAGLQATGMAKTASKFSYTPKRLGTLPRKEDGQIVADRWFYPNVAHLGNPKFTFLRTHESTPIHYMKKAKAYVSDNTPRYVKQYVKKNIKKGSVFSTSIRRAAKDLPEDIEE